MLIKIPDERAEQLKAIAAVQNLTVTDLIGQFVNAQIKAGKIPDTTPGFVVTKNGKQVEIAAERRVSLSAADALHAAEWLEKLIGGRGAMLDMDAPEQIEIARVGTGVKITIGSGAKAFEKVFAPSVARDVARQLRNAAKAA